MLQKLHDIVHVMFYEILLRHCTQVKLWIINVNKITF
jgi:hypothetical protein